MNNNRNGQALIEYILIVAIIAIITVAIVSFLGGYVVDAIKKSSCNIMNQEYVAGEKPGKGTCKNKEELID